MPLEIEPVICPTCHHAPGRAGMTAREARGGDGTDETWIACYCACHGVAKPASGLPELRIDVVDPGAIRVTSIKVGGVELLDADPRPRPTTAALILYAHRLFEVAERLEASDFGEIIHEGSPVNVARDDLAALLDEIRACEVGRG